MALAALQGDATLAELSQRFDVHANQVTQWKQHWLANAVAVFGEREDRQQEGEIERLHAKIATCTIRKKSSIINDHRFTARDSSHAQYNSQHQRRV